MVPKSAHGTNSASVSKLGLLPIDIEIDKLGQIDISDLNNKIEFY